MRWILFAAAYARNLLAQAQEFPATLLGMDKHAVGIAEPLFPGSTHLAAAAPVLGFASVQRLDQLGVDLGLQLLGKSLKSPSRIQPADST